MNPMLKNIFVSLGSLTTLLLMLQSCNTLYSTKVTQIEILEPAKVKIPENYKTLALKYNNANVSYNPFFASYYLEGEKQIDTINTDSIASFIHFYQLEETLRNQGFFETVASLNPSNYQHTLFLDSINHKQDTTFNQEDFQGKVATQKLINHINKYPLGNANKTENKYIHPTLGLYSEEELKNIADTSGADLLLSLDYFSTEHGISYMKITNQAITIVHTNSFWTGYDLRELKLKFSYLRKDTIHWSGFDEFKKMALKQLPSRKDALLNAADIAASKFADFLIPHWVQVERMYYTSGHPDLQNVDQLVEENKWIEAAKLWKKQTQNKNKSIVAKCMYNMALACEMQGNLEAALEWVVKAYHILGDKNEVHQYNCQEYIRILAQRKVDKEKLDEQFTSNSN